MLGHPLNHINNIQHLAVHIQNNLKWNKHVNHETTEAIWLPGFVQCNLHQCSQNVKAQAYFVLPGPILETREEKVERWAARFAIDCWFGREECIANALTQLQQRPFQVLRREARLTQMYKIINEYYTTSTELPQDFRPQQSRYSRRNHHSNNLTRPHTRSDTWKNSFLTRTNHDWMIYPKTWLIMFMRIL